MNNRLERRMGKAKEECGIANVDVKIEIAKRSLLDDVMRILRRILDMLLHCLTCGCCNGKNHSNFMGELYDHELLDTEKLAVENLLQYLEKDAEASLNEEGLRALRILTYSDNSELQQSAALCYLEISEKMQTPLTEPMAGPLVDLLKSKNESVQKASTLAVSNFVLHCPEYNQPVILACGIVKPLLRLLSSPSVDVLCNTCGCITTLTTSDECRYQIVVQDGMKPILKQLKSPDIRVQRNSMGAILNLTQMEMSCQDIVNRGGITVLLDFLGGTDNDVLYYCTGAIGNIAMSKQNRSLFSAIGDEAVTRQLIKLLSSKCERVKCQSCIALRNLACDAKNQESIVRHGGLTLLHTILRTTTSREVTTVVLGCLRNLSLFKANQVVFISEDLLGEIARVLSDSSNTDAQRHAAGTIQNLSDGEFIKMLIQSGCVQVLMMVVLQIECKISVLTEVTGALSILAASSDVKQQIVLFHDGLVFYKLISLASLSTDTEIQYNSAGTLGQVFMMDIPEALKVENKQGILLYIDRFLKSSDSNFVHLGLWTLVHLLKDDLFFSAFQEHNIEYVVQKVLQSEHNKISSISKLAYGALEMLQDE